MCDPKGVGTWLRISDYREEAGDLVKAQKNLEKGLASTRKKKQTRREKSLSNGEKKRIVLV